MKRINKKLIACIIGASFGYLFTHYLISPFIFGTKGDEKTTTILTALDQVLDQERASIPLKVDELTTLIAVDRRDFKVAYIYSVDIETGESKPSTADIAQKQKKLCQGLNQNLLHNIEYDYIYKDRYGNIFLTVPVNSKVCFI